MNDFHAHLSPHMGLFHQISVSSFQKEPYHWQVLVGGTVLHSVASNRSIQQLCVRPTGGGKTLLFTVLARCIKGVTLCITPLLSLGSDQVRKLINTSTFDQSITAFHLDELDENQINEVSVSVSRQALHPSKTVILFVSPQCILGPCQDLFNNLLQQQLIRFVVVDEIHLVCSFGKSFRRSEVLGILPLHSLV
jgi:superfamily II DNA helicase RecQ